MFARAARVLAPSTRHNRDDGPGPVTPRSRPGHAPPSLSLGHFRDKRPCPPRSWPTIRLLQFVFSRRTVAAIFLHTHTQLRPTYGRTLCGGLCRKRRPERARADRHKRGRRMGMADTARNTRCARCGWENAPRCGVPLDVVSSQHGATGPPPDARCNVGMTRFRRIRAGAKGHPFRMGPAGRCTVLHGPAHAARFACGAPKWVAGS